MVFVVIAKAVTVGVHLRWIRMQNVDFKAVAQEVAVCVCVNRVRLVFVDLVAVADAIPVGVRVKRIGQCGQFFLVRQSVLILITARSEVATQRVLSVQVIDHCNAVADRECAVVNEDLPDIALHYRDPVIPCTDQEGSVGVRDDRRVDLAAATKRASEIMPQL